MQNQGFYLLFFIQTLVVTVPIPPSSLSRLAAPAAATPQLYTSNLIENCQSFIKNCQNFVRISNEFFCCFFLSWSFLLRRSTIHDFHTLFFLMFLFYVYHVYLKYIILIHVTCSRHIHDINTRYVANLLCILVYYCMYLYVVYMLLYVQ